ncbi:NLI interacting factor-like phosphatase (macronuclear) [Tetrahymena thermophila SB210]|uniref:NLI interacting factor-like phosphatase n=1 Tax=Tetrahymena thermophila (strain SB210) TaxID=312017 RepID=I7MIC4_TETTS|nr:NLI interacting factor-like phosphatase [Tetrahymena thermophila SB210]EAR92879.2 NLI interacting factor-like phosphatase [Tetrahymena thermophila SB210]|eukprot:XP_001013124.2 NLI interacting factor-like phosphatase [Tetrahymena thermophila SB210]
MMNYMKKKFSKSKEDYESTNSENSQTTSNTYHQNGKKHTKKQQQLAKPPMQNNIPSFITQVTRDGKPMQFYPQNDNNESPEVQETKKISFLERLCSCFKTKQQQISEEDEVSQIEQESSQKSTDQQQMQKQDNQEVQQQQQQQQQQQKQRAPLQTSLPKVIQPQDPKFQGKKSLIIDLDETLVHSSFTVIQNADFTLQITVQNMPFIVYVKKRPGCEFFLEELSKYYELIIYTASLSEYADPVMDRIDKNGVCSLRLFRENCTLYNGVFVKDLSLMQRDLKDLIIIDNSETSFLFQPANAVHIKSFFDDMKDRELYRLIPMLIFLSNSFDVRHVGNWWREFEQNDFIDYRDKKNRLQRLDKQRLLEELGDLRQRDLQMEAESMYDNSSQLMMNQGRESFTVSPKNSVSSQQQLFNGKKYENDKRQEKYKKNFTQKKPLMIEVPEAEEEDNLPAARNKNNKDINQNIELESVRNKLLASPDSQYQESVSSTKNGYKQTAFKFNEYEDYNKRIKEEDPYNFKTQPDAIEENSESYKEMKQIFDNIRYCTNTMNVNSPVSKERFIQLLDNNSYRKKTEKHSQQNDQEAHYFASPKKQQIMIKKVESVKNDQDGLMSQLSYKPDIQDEEQDELTNKDSDDIAIINKEEQEDNSQN